jgi:hypothetical protein
LKKLGINSIYRGYLLFNTIVPSTSSLESAKLCLYKNADFSTNDFTLTIQNGQPTYPHNPLQTGDYWKGYYSGNGGGLNTTSFVNGWNNITLSNLTWVNRNGLTKLALRSNKDISGTPPSTNEYVTIFSGNAASQYQPKLIVSYRNQSKIQNTGLMTIKGYLLMQVQYRESDSSPEVWKVDHDVVNETTPRTINVGGTLHLDRIFNGVVRASDLQHGAGCYRVYAAFRDPEGNILVTSDGVMLAAGWQFDKT